MKIIFDNIIFSLQKMGGGSVYWYELLIRLLKDVSVDPVLISRDDLNVLHTRLKAEVSITEFIENKPLLLDRYSKVSIKPEFLDSDLFHSSYFRIPNYSGIKQILTVHDCIYELYFSGLRKFVHISQKKQSILHASGIICVSNNTKNDLLKFYPSLNKANVKVIYNGASDSDYYPIDRMLFLEKFLSIIGLNQIVPFFLYVGDRANSYKNFAFAIEFLASFKGSMHFFVAGKPLTETEKNLLVLKKVSFTNIVNPTNSELNILYNFAECLLYPSSYEGFGIPVVEAMMSGCPVIALNSSSITEVYAVPSILPSTLNISDFRRQYREILSNRDELIRSGISFAKQFTWDHSIKKHKEYYEEILNEN